MNNSRVRRRHNAEDRARNG